MHAVDAREHVLIAVEAIVAEIIAVTNAHGDARELAKPHVDQLALKSATMGVLAVKTTVPQRVKDAK